MSTESRAGRPKASSRETLAEAACELFLERGFEQTSIVDITRRAGVSRSSFFNYFSSKSEVLWSGLDVRIADFQLAVTDAAGDATTVIRNAVLGIGADFVPDTLALALMNTRAMGIEEDLDREASLRRSRIARIVAERLSAAGADRLRADVAGSAYGGAVLAAVDAWAHDGAGRTSLQRFLARAVTIAELAAVDVAVDEAAAAVDGRDER